MEKLVTLNQDANFSLRLLVPIIIKGLQDFHIIEQQVVGIKNQLVNLNKYVDARGKCIDKQCVEALKAATFGSLRQHSLTYEKNGYAAMMKSLKKLFASIVAGSDAAENEYFAVQEVKTTQHKKITALAHEISQERHHIAKEEEETKAAEAEEQKRKEQEMERKRQAAEQELRLKSTEEAERKCRATEEEAKRKQLEEEPKKKGRPKRGEVLTKKAQLNSKPRATKRRNAPSPSLTSSGAEAEMEDDGDAMSLASKQPAIVVPRSPDILPQAGQNVFGTPDNNMGQQNKKPRTCWRQPSITDTPRKTPTAANIGSPANKAASSVITKNMPPQTPKKTASKPLLGRQQQSIVDTPRSQPSTSSSNNYQAAAPPVKKNADLEKTMDTDYDFSDDDDSFWAEE